MDNVFMLALMAAPIAASAAWGVGSVEIGSNANGDGNVVRVSGIRCDGCAPTGKVVAVTRAITSAGADAVTETTATQKVTFAGDSFEYAATNGYRRAWRIGFGYTYDEARRQANLVCGAVRMADGSWRTYGTANGGFSLGIKIERNNPAITIFDADPTKGSVIEIVGSRDLRTWSKPTAEHRFFKAIQKEAAK